MTSCGYQRNFCIDLATAIFPHFLGAVVLQQVQNVSGTLQERTVIDGQQRLTTLQLLFDALHAELLGVKATAPAMRLEPLVVNAAPFCRQVREADYARRCLREVFRERLWIGVNIEFWAVQQYEFEWLS